MLVYLLNGVGSFEKKQASFLKFLYEKQTIRHYQALHQIYVVNPNLLFKSDLMISLGLTTKIIKQKLIYLENLLNLEEQSFFRMEFYCKMPDLIIEKSNKKMDYSVQVFKEELSKKLDSVEISVHLLGKNLSDFALSDTGVPFVIMALIGYFEYLPEALDYEGLFRISGGISEEKRLEELLEKQKFNSIFSIQSPIVVGGVLKKIFGQMPTPLFPYEVYDKLKEFHGIFVFFL